MTKRPTWKLALWITGRVFLVAYLGVLLILLSLELSLIFPAPRYPQGDWQPAGVAREDAWFAAADGTQLHGWYFPHAAPRRQIVYFHGNAEHVAHNRRTGELLRDRLEAAVLIFDYRGYGRSQGRPDEAGLLADGRAAVDWLCRRAGVPPGQVVLMGRSIGGAVAIDVAAELPVRALVLENTFSSLPDVAAGHFPCLPVRLLMRTRFDSLRKIAGYLGPVHQTHGTSDEVVPYRLGQKLYAAVPGRKAFFEVPGGDHNSPPPPEYYDALARFLNELDAPVE